jgi:hypothetical protein
MLTSNYFDNLRIQGYCGLLLTCNYGIIRHGVLSLSAANVISFYLPNRINTLNQPYKLFSVRPIRELNAYEKTFNLILMFICIVGQFYDTMNTYNSFRSATQYICNAKQCKLVA